MYRPPAGRGSVRRRLRNHNHQTGPPGMFNPRLWYFMYTLRCCSFEDGSGYWLACVPVMLRTMLDAELPAGLGCSKEHRR